MSTPTIIVTVLAVAAIGTTPAVASAATGGSDQPPPSRITANHNEVLVGS